MMIIGIIGPKRSGKSTLTKHLVDRYGFERSAFADPMKRALMSAFGLTWEQVYGSEKEVPTLKLCGRTPRHAMMTMGTEWGREMIHPDIWLAAWSSSILGKADPIVIEDVRFPNEYAELKKIGATVISVRRQGCDYDMSHESEAHADLPWDHRVVNDEGICDFKVKIDLLCCELNIIKRQY